MALEQKNNENVLKFPMNNGDKLSDSEIKKINDKYNSLPKYDNNAVNGMSEVSIGTDIIKMSFYDYAISLMSKYQVSDYHRMMTEDEIYTFIDLYAKEFNTNIETAMKTFEETVKQQLSYQRNENEIKQQGLAQEKLMSMSSNYTSKYGKNFIVYLNDEELENYSIQYLRSYVVKRSDVNKMYEESLNNAYADSIIKGMEKGTVKNTENMIDVKDTPKNMGFSILKMFMLITFVSVCFVLFTGLYFIVNG